MTDDPAEIEQLEARLQRGWELIERAEASADEQAASRYTTHWLQLLSDYERLANPQAAPRAGAAEP